MSGDCILISDDDRFVARALERQLRRLLPSVRVVHDGRCDVVTLAAGLRPLLVVLDLVQPVNGVQLLRELRTGEETRALPVVAISAVDDEEARAHCDNFGVAAFYEKPFADDFVEALALIALQERASRRVEEAAAVH